MLMLVQIAWRTVMLKVTGALIVTVGLSVGTVFHSYAQSNAAPLRKAAQATFVRHEKVCRYYCPPGYNVCQGEINPQTGCPFYRCFKGQVGNNQCP
jgi:hypothetical protein